MNGVKGQLMTRALLSILKHRTIDKAVERCEMSIVEGEHDDADEDEDTLESKLVLRLYCKHGIVKTHRLLLQTPISLLSPANPDPERESRLTIGPRAIKDITEHFQGGRGSKSDPSLVWSFGNTDVEVKSLESSIDTKGKAQLSTELTISAEEFDVYAILAPPITISFHLREFNASVAFADSMSQCLDFRFTDPAAPLFIDVEGDECTTLFVISTSQAPNAPSNNDPIVSRNNARKRPLFNEDDGTESTASNSRPVEKFKKPMKAVQRMDSHSVTSSSRFESAARSVPPPSLPPPPSVASSLRFVPPPSLPPQPPFAPSARVQSAPRSVPPSSLPPPSFLAPPQHLPFSPGANATAGPSTPRKELPLFLSSQVSPQWTTPPPKPQPPAPQGDRLPLFFPMTQMSAADEEAIISSGLGIEHMNADELEAMLEGEGEEVEIGSQKPRNDVSQSRPRQDSKANDEDEDYFRYFDDDIEVEFEPTQSVLVEGEKSFQPLFDD